MEKEKYLSVSALTKYIKYKFDNDTHLKNVFLKGEISNFKHHSRGHFYFTLKDESSQISAIMFASSSKNVVFTVENGMHVLVTGSLSVYEAGGSYQIYVKSLTEDGIGNLYIAYEQLKKKLANEGLFEQNHKIAIPKFPKSIAVLTSPTGAAVADVINIINRRYPLASIIVYPTLVQGEYAKDSIIKQLKAANDDGLVDVIILGRGGGSIEDLWPFNEEEVAREIYKSVIPIISSVGHETDFTISDFVADLRAPTPSGGAELAVPNKAALLSYIESMRYQSSNTINRMIKAKKDKLQYATSSYVLEDPLRLTENASRKLDFLKEKLNILNPINRLNQNVEKVIRLEKQLLEYYNRNLNSKQYQYINTINKLELLNPLSIMKKGYSVTKLNNKIINSIKQINTGDDIEITLTDGIVKASVKEVRKGE
ncbi:MAG: exodeoxyribonuclease VII large subunit [Candidatus Izemoplasma sp.]